MVFHVDAGWNSQIAVNNIEKLVDGLGLDLYTEVIDWEEIKDLQLAFFKSGIPHIDVPQDHAFFATMCNFAAKYKIKYILTGANYSTECVRNPMEWMDYNHYRPHSSLGYMAPAAFAAKCLEQGFATLRLPQDKGNTCEILS